MEQSSRMPAALGKKDNRFKKAAIHRRRKIGRLSRLLGLWLLIFAMAGMGFASTASPALAQPGDGVSFELNPSSDTVTLGDTFSVVVQVTTPGSQQIDLAELYLGFDPAVLQVNSMTNESSLSVEIVAPATDNNAGTIGTGFGALSNFPSAPFDFLTIEFEAVGEGTSQLEFLDPEGAASTIATFGGAKVLNAAVNGSITVEGPNNQAPSADAGPDQTVTDSDNSGAETVTLDGSASSDPDGNLVSYSWRENDSEIATGSSPDVSLPVGIHNLTLIVTDDEGLTDTDTVVVTVQAATQIDDVFVLVDPELSEVAVGQTFEVFVQVQSGEQPVDAAEVHIDFDPSLLQVQSLTPDTSELSTELVAPSYDNNAGEIDYAVGTLSDYPNGTFNILAITFQAVAASESTDLTFATEFPRATQSTYGGNSVLTGTSPGTVTITNLAEMVGTVNLQGRPAAPDPSWSVPVTVTLYEQGETTPMAAYTSQTDQNGQFTVDGITSGTYLAAVKNAHTLQRVQSVSLSAGSNAPVDFGALLEGDANNDNMVTLADFFILAGTYNLAVGDPGSDERADFNENDFVMLDDFSLLTSNFNRLGETISSVSGQSVTASVKETFTGDDVTLYASVPGEVTLGEIFSVQIIIESGDQAIDAAGAELQFGAQALQVVSVEGSTAFEKVLNSTFDNRAGAFIYEAGTLGGEFPAGDTVLATVYFESLAPDATASIQVGEGSRAYRAGVDLLSDTVVDIDDADAPQLDLKLFLPLVDKG